MQINRLDKRSKIYLAIILFVAFLVGAGTIYFVFEINWDIIFQSENIEQPKNENQLLKDELIKLRNEIKGPIKPISDKDFESLRGTDPADKVMSPSELEAELKKIREK